MMLTIQKRFFFIFAAVILSQNHHLPYLWWPKVKLKVDNATYGRGSSILVLGTVLFSIKFFSAIPCHSEIIPL